MQREPLLLQYKFDACPKDELFDCWCYELARELGWLREFVATQNAKKLEELAQATYYAFLLFHHWPVQPYLSIDRSERQRLLRSARPTIKELESRFFEPGEVPKGIEESLRTSLRQSGRSAIKSKNSRMEIALFKLDWQLEDSVLIRFFKSYLELNRPSQINPTKHRARNVPDASRRQQLKELGMSRLLRANSDFSANAIHKALGCEIPVDKVDAWYHARERTDALIKEVSAEWRRRLADAI
jgi:hypothetical protein